MNLRDLRWFPLLVENGFLPRHEHVVSVVVIEKKPKSPLLDLMQLSRVKCRSSIVRFQKKWGARIIQFIGNNPASEHSGFPSPVGEPTVCEIWYFVTKRCIFIHNRLEECLPERAENVEDSHPRGALFTILFVELDGHRQVRLGWQSAGMPRMYEKPMKTIVDDLGVDVIREIKWWPLERRPGIEIEDVVEVCSTNSGSDPTGQACEPRWAQQCA